MAKKAELKTQVNEASVDAFLDNVRDEEVRKDCFEILKMMKQITKAEPKMWGSSIVGFGSYHYKGKSGREGDWFLTGFSPRKPNISLYLMAGFDAEKDLLEKLGKHKTSMGCLYIKRLDDIDKKILKELITKSVKKLKQLNK